MKRATLVRRVELVERTRQPAPPTYVVAPRNREQRRLYERELARAVKQASKGR